MRKSFNSPWECRIGLTAIRCCNDSITPVNFQFPVGMSNRSYLQKREIESKVEAYIFQFPVGMSNRSYALEYGFSAQEKVFDFQFPVGMSNRSYTGTIRGCAKGNKKSLSIPRGNVE